MNLKLGLAMAAVAAIAAIAFLAFQNPTGLSVLQNSFPEA